MNRSYIEVRTNVAKTVQFAAFGRFGCLVGHCRHLVIHEPGFGATDFYGIHTLYAFPDSGSRRGRGRVELGISVRCGALRTMDVEQRRRLEAVGRRLPDQHDFQSYRTHCGHDLLLLDTRGERIGRDERLVGAKGSHCCRVGAHDHVDFDTAFDGLWAL